MKIVHVGNEQKDTAPHTKSMLLALLVSEAASDSVPLSSSGKGRCQLPRANYQEPFANCYLLIASFRYMYFFGRRIVRKSVPNNLLSSFYSGYYPVQ